MRLFSREASRYAALLILLFTIAALAVWHTLSLLLDRLTSDDFVIIASLICVITFGFMLIAGAFGLWAIQFSAREEARRRISQLVDAMDYLTDGIVVIDSKQHILAGNPAAHSIAGKDSITSLSLRDAFEALEAPDVEFLLESDEAIELERSATKDNTRLRFRSLPSGGLTLVLVSDVTNMESRRTASRQSARLQLIGEISRGVAHDFNNLLCSIAGYASLLPKLPANTPDFTHSISAIENAVEKGTALAGHLLELTRPLDSVSFSPMSNESIQTAADQLKETLPPSWAFDVNIEPLPPLAMSSVRIGQIVTNLGVIAADQVTTPGTLTVWAGTPNTTQRLLNIDPSFGAVVIVTCGSMHDDTWTSPIAPEDDNSGVILSVIRTMLDQSDSSLDVMFTANGTPIYRICIPMTVGPATAADSIKVAAELGPYLANWDVLLAVQQDFSVTLETSMSSMNINIHRVESLPALLEQADSGQARDGIVIEKALVEEATGGIIKAIVKLCPDSAVVVLSETPTPEDDVLRQEVAVLAGPANPDQVMLALVEAKALAVRRHRPTA